MVNGDPTTAYVVRPATKGVYPGVILGFELFGTTPYIRATADKIAAWGYVVIVPDFYHRSAPGISLLADDEGRKRGFELLHQLTRAHSLADVHAAISYLKNEGCPSVGMVGLSVGGHIAYAAAAKLDIQAVAVCYAGWLPETSFPISQPTPTLDLTPQIAGRNIHMLFIVGENDTLIPTGQQIQIQRALQSADVKHDFVVYPGASHGFLCKERPSYDQHSANDAWSRIESMLARELT